MTDLIERTLHRLREQLSGRVSRPGDARYVAATAIWAKPVGRMPRAVAHCRTAEDVRSAIRAARDCHLPLSVRGGGHDWAGRALCEGLVIRVDDFPTDEVLDEMAIDSEFGLLGLFHGVGLPFRSESAPAQMPNMVWLYRVPIVLYWAEHDETLGAIITHVLVHEIGHHFGLSDADMEAIEAGVE